MQFMTRCTSSVPSCQPVHYLLAELGPHHYFVTIVICSGHLLFTKRLGKYSLSLGTPKHNLIFETRCIIPSTLDCTMGMGKSDDNFTLFNSIVKSFFSKVTKQYCWILSIKTGIGHLNVRFGSKLWILHTEGIFTVSQMFVVRGTRFLNYTLFSPPVQTCIGCMSNSLVISLLSTSILGGVAPFAFLKNSLQAS